MQLFDLALQGSGRALAAHGHLQRPVAAVRRLFTADGRLQLMAFHQRLRSQHHKAAAPHRDAGTPHGWGLRR